MSFCTVRASDSLAEEQGRDPLSVVANATP